jgi:uncharacterized protein YndB with AHSA1/START domain
MNNEPFVIERIVNAPIEKVWQAITDKDKMKQWYFDVPEFKPVPGTEFSFEAGNKDRKFIHLCKVIEVVDGRKLKHSWRYEGEPGDSFVTWELSEEGEGTKVKLTHEGLETFPQTADFAKENFVAGWTQIVGTSLPKYVEKAA